MRDSVVNFGPTISIILALESLGMAHDIMTKIIFT